ncbi:putative reverse transcriptase domain-containing protein [Tanacetum coccineum]
MRRIRLNSSRILKFGGYGVSVRRRFEEKEGVCFWVLKIWSDLKGRSADVLFFLSTMPFDYGMRGAENSGPTAHIGTTNVTVNMAMEKQSSLVDTTGLGSYQPLPKQVATSAGNAPGKSSFANVTGKPSGKKLNFHTLFTPRGNGIHVVVLVESIRTGKYGMVRSMFSSSTELFSFKFSFMDGLDAMHENGSWFIHNNPLIMRKWHPNENLLKEDVNTIPVWVKLHGVPVTAFSEDSLSAIATKLGTPLMLDSYTADMCMQSWGRSSYARAMIELRADVELKDNIMAAMPKITRDGYYTCNIHVEYE